MADELINDRHSSSYSSSSPLVLDRPLKLKPENPFSIIDPYATNTISSCKDFPLPSHGSQLFLEKEEPVVALPLEEKLKQKESFIKRLRLVNLKAELTAFLAKVKDKLEAWKNQIVDFFRGPKPVKKPDVSPKNAELYAPKATPSQKQTQTKKAENKEVPPINFQTDSTEDKRIKEIEESLAQYQEELSKLGGGDIKAMIEMACKMAILVGSLGYRYNKKEMKDYLDHLEVNVKQRIKTMETGHTWTYLAVGLQVTAAAFAFGSLGAGALSNAAPTFSAILKGLGTTTQPVMELGGGFNKMSDVRREKNNALRTGYEHESDKLKQTRTDMDRCNEKIHQLMQEMLAAVRNLNQTHTESVKRAAAA